MKYIKLFEAAETFKVGDTVYCTENRGYERDIEIGVPYTIEKIEDVSRHCSDNSAYMNLTIKELESRWSAGRFSKDPDHPDILKHKLSPIANKYNL